MKYKILLPLIVICLFAVVPVKAEAKKKQTIVEVGKEKQLTVKNMTKWHSMNKSVAKVDKKGNLTGMKTGSTTVTAKKGKKKYSYNVTAVNFKKMTQMQESVVRFALKHVGNKYRYGGSSLTKGTDCSGFTMSVFKKFGFKLPHNAARQMKSKKTRKVKTSKLKPGDLIFYGRSKKSCSHVALYIGSKKVVHASTKRTGITISHYKYRRPIAACRVLK